MITSQKELRAEFWAMHPDLPRKKIRDYKGTGRMYQTDTRCAWVDFLDYLQRDGQISTALADRAEL